jgi:plasmid replication initiation protein
MNKKEAVKARGYKVVKHNDFIRNSRYELSMQEHKIILYLITKIRPEDTDFEPYEFSIQEFCEVCGIDSQSGRNYENIKATILKLAQKAFWLKLNDGIQVTARWLDRAYVYKQSGIISLKLDDLLKPYLLELRRNFTAYNLYHILAMKSAYSIRMYELLKSQTFVGEYAFDVDELKKLLFAENYELFSNFKARVLDTAVREINDFGDIAVSYAVEKAGRKVDKVIFSIREKKEALERVQTYNRIEKSKIKLN